MQTIYTVQHTAEIAHNHVLVVGQMPDGWEVTIEGPIRAAFHVGRCSDSEVKVGAYHLAVDFLRSTGVLDFRSLESVEWKKDIFVPRARKRAHPK
jgi:hypothetical protein